MAKKNNAGLILREALIRQGITVKKFAEWLEVSRQNVHLLLNKDKFSKSTTLIISSLLGIEPEELGYSSSSYISEFSSQVDLEGVKFENCNLEKKYLKRVNLSNSRIRNTSFNGAFLANSDFSGANLKLVSFENTNLSKSDFSNSELISINLRFADLTEVNLFNTDLSSANLEGCNLKNVKNWKDCIINKAYISGIKNMPRGFANWAFENQATENLKLWQDPKFHEFEVPF